MPYTIEVVSQDPYTITLTNLGAQGIPGESNVFETRDVSSNDSILLSDRGIRASDTITLTLPSAVGIGNQFFRIKNVGTGIVTVATILSQTIDGDSGFSLLESEAVVIRSNGSNWEIW